MKKQLKGYGSSQQSTRRRKILKGEERSRVWQQAVIAIIVSLFQQVLAMTETGHYSPEEKITVLKKCYEATDALLENKDVPAVLLFGPMK